jgi:hypothetical protein
VVDNQPLELARSILDVDFFNPEARGDKVDRALVAIAPFPDLGSYPVQEPPPGNPFLLDLAARTLYAAVNQMRFQPGLASAVCDRDVFNRFLIAPQRDPVPGATIRSRIACDSLGGFGGFLSREFREHDFQLGRRNCQRFLREDFALPWNSVTGNPLFASWTSAAQARYLIAGSTRTYLPIIPLRGKAEIEVKLPTWPKYSQAELDTLRGRIKTRLGSVGRRLIARNTSFPWRQGLSTAWDLYFKGHLAEKIVQNVESDLRDRKLMR